jgi:hypothetical protein
VHVRLSTRRIEHRRSSSVYAPKLICSDNICPYFLPCRFAGRQIHASEDDGSVNHALIRDYDAEVSRLDRFGQELEEST